MSIFKRMALVIRSTINALIGSAEDPAKIMDTVIADLGENMSEVKLQVATAIKDEKTLERKANENQRLASDYEGKAMAALQRGDEPLAIEALKRKQSCAALAVSLGNELTEQKRVVELLKDGTRNLENRIEEAKSKRTVLVAQQKRAETRTQLTSNVGSLSKQSELLETFDQMAEKIAGIEDMSAATVELDTYANERKLTEAKLRNIEFDSVIADDLARLKAKIKPIQLAGDISDAEIVVTKRNEVANK